MTTSHRALWQIVTNLTSNAIKFTTKGSVSLELHDLATERDQEVEIAINDTGVGIRAEDQDKLFLPFSRVGEGTNQNQEGTGLGLHISQRLASLIGARITMVSQYGKGSTFVISLKTGTVNE